MAGAFILAIDQGTTSTTVMVFDHSGRVRGRASGQLTQHYPKPGWVEHDPDEIRAITAGMVQQAMATAEIGAADLHAIGITNQRETTVLWDRQSGRPVVPAIVWQDRRTAPACEQLKARGLEPEVRDKTGLVLDPYFSATKISWLLNNVPGLRQRAEAGEIAFGTIDSWLIWCLTDGAVHATDVSNASRTLLFNIHTLKWDDDLLALFDLPPALLPEVKPSAHVYGVTAGKGPLGGHAVPLAGVAGDQQAALFGQACYGRGQAKNTYGTGSFLLMNIGGAPAVSTRNLLTTIAWKIGDEPVEYASEGSIFITGAVLQWLCDGLGLIANGAEAELLAATLADNEGVYLVPALTGLGAPHWDPFARGLVVGLTRGTKRAHLARAALESICYQCRDVADAMQRDTGIALEDLRADGGGSDNAFLMQFQADILGVPVAVPEVTETTALGAAYLAGLATGFWAGKEEITSHWRAARRFVPKMAAARREALYQRWLKAVVRAKDWARDDPG